MIRAALVSCTLIAACANAFADPLVFEGRIEASNRAVVSTQLNGVVAQVLFRGGAHVEAGEPLITLDPDDATLALRAAEARVAEATAVLDGAERDARRQEELLARGVAADAVAGRARTALGAAQAALALAEAERDRARLDMERTIIRAPISGVVSEPGLSTGTFIEAEAGPPLATIVALDPVRVAYHVPYADRIRSVQESGAETLADLFERVELTLTLPGGFDYPHPAQPEYASADLNPETGALTVWATVPNPDTILRPGLSVTVTAVIAPE